MASHARHARPRARTLLQAGLTLSAAGAVALVSGGAAQADIVNTSDPLGTVGHAVTPIKQLQLDPLANTGVDPLDNGVGTQIADFQPLGTTQLTAPLTQGGTLGSLPLTGELTGLLPG
ncbi:hypothetical protein QNO07_04505 [Streptomyces sp. 549]|uniref:hypothetical protein n=1 Tax=Streptomyces sp. 549 TaxID=3049076 RepID=UPI0024C44683|nr:hypothetical protein [Streptomyces sp. 549]MDK1472693.1 hypothetical protein [Streptomyces sp. 549]